MTETSAYSSWTRWIVTVTVVLVAVMEVLDITIVNVSLPNMMGALGASSEQITWVLTSYSVSAAICMPLTGFLVERFGQKKLLLLNVAGFTIASILCGLSTSLAQMVICRILQGVFGAALVPLSQLILQQIFSQAEQRKAMAIWGVGIMVAPVLGPTLGGYITQALNWRWVFFINIPVGICSFVLAWRYVRESMVRLITVDWRGIFWLAVGVGCFQIFLDRGNQSDWFEAHSIILLAIITVFALGFFVKHSLRYSKPVVELRLFTDRNFLWGCVLMTGYCSATFGVVALQPLLTESYMNYPADITGIIMAPRALTAAMVMTLLGSKIARSWDSRHLLAAGLVFSAIGTWMMSQFDLQASMGFMMWAGAVQGIGMGLFFVPLTVVAFSSLSAGFYAQATGLFSFWRSLGSSIGISLCSTLVTRLSQINWNRLSGHIQIYNPNLTLWLQRQHWDLQNPLALQQLAGQLTQQSAMIAFIDSFWLIALVFLAMVPIVYLLDRPQGGVGLDRVGH